MRLLSIVISVNTKIPDIHMRKPSADSEVSEASSTAIDEHDSKER